MADEFISRAEAHAKGLKHYKTGLACKRGHLSERLVSNRQCCGCSCGEMRARREANPDKARASWRKYQKENRERVRESTRKWQESNREKSSASSRKWQIANPERVRQNHHNYRLKNPAKVRDIFREWSLENPEKVRAKDRNRRARKRAALGSHTAKDIIDIFKQQNGKCAYCAIKFGKKYQVDHIVALAKGGSNDRRNLQLLCSPCNGKKSAKDPLDFARELGRLL